MILLSFAPAVSLAQVGAQTPAAPQLEALDSLFGSQDPSFLPELDKLIASTSSLSYVHQVLQRYLDRESQAAYVPELARRKARLYELEGDYEAGRATLAALEEALLLEGSDPPAVELARLELELGNLREAEAWLSRLTGRRVTRESLREITVLRCRVSLAQEHESSFRSCVDNLDTQGWGGMALSLSLQWARKQGDQEEATRLSSLLREDYPLIWGSLTATEGRVSRYPSPAFILVDGTIPPVGSLAPAPEPPAEDTAAPEPAEAAPLGVQVGSFRDRENAEYMARDVSALGFSVSIRTRERNGGSYHQVLVTPPAGSDPQTTVVRLKEHGLEGFLVFE